MPRAIYTHDHQAPAWFMDIIRGMEGDLDCRWNAILRRFEILERNRKGHWEIVFTVQGRQPDQRDITRLRNAAWNMKQQFEEWWDREFQKPQEADELRREKLVADTIGDRITDNIDYLVGTPKVGYDRTAATGLKELSDG